MEFVEFLKRYYSLEDNNYIEKLTLLFISQYPEKYLYDLIYDRDLVYLSKHYSYLVPSFHSSKTILSFVISGSKLGDPFLRYFSKNLKINKCYSKDYIDKLIEDYPYFLTKQESYFLKTFNLSIVYLFFKKIIWYDKDKNPLKHAPSRYSNNSEINYVRLFDKIDCKDLKNLNLEKYGKELE